MQWSTGPKPIRQRSLSAMWCVTKTSSMLIMVRDPGTGFDPGQIPNPLRGENVYSDHGRGIFLINQLMDEVKFLKNGTEIHMMKK